MLILNDYFITKSKQKGDCLKMKDRQRKAIEL